ncbi:MAG TPA: hypothetical protein VGH56_13110, partial [Solirubrobacteraceae bacterium]
MTFAHSGHFPQIDDPLGFAATVLDFLDETEPSRLTAAAWQELLRDAPLSDRGPDDTRTRAGLEVGARKACPRAA